ncbi:protein kinase [Gemmatimonas sp.]|uniref:protein kinase domain-containing protein n=1 Tax=Gemmatimonas sp. TaxID=1962908 RepID=UPI00286B9239|nr:protein kinase [Gemmatimonas sp.]
MNPSDVRARLTTALAGRYRLERELGAGGMATVYLAQDERHHRRVAIKVLHPELSAVLGTERFLKEIALTAGLQHPHILPLFDSGSADGLVFYVMPFVDGETLRARLDRERQLPIADAVRIAQDVAGALDYAHKRGIVHRDVKPENILLHDGRPMVADFGIALAVSEAGGQRMTQTGLSLGTPQYMAPEQAMGEKTVDARADVFALGVVTYEMLAGEPPFTGPTMQAIVAKVLATDPVPVTELRKSVPEHVWEAVATALEKLPADRHASAEKFAMALGDTAGTARRQSGARASSAHTSRSSTARRALPWVGGLAAGALLGVLGAKSVTGSTTTVPTDVKPVRFVVTAPDSLEVQAVCCGQMMVLSPDGRTLVFQARTTPTDSTMGAPPQRLVMRELGSLTSIVLPGTDGATSLSISPDGQQLLYVAYQRLFRMPLRGGAATEITQLPTGFVSGTTWLSDARVLVTVGATIYSADLQSSQLSTFLKADSLERQPVGPSAVAGGHGVLFAYGGLERVPAVYWLATGSSAPRQLMPGATPTYVPAWKRLLVNREGALLAFPFDPVKGDTTGPAVKVADGNVLRSPILAHAEYAVAPNGTLVLARRESDGLAGAWTQNTSITLRRNGANTPIRTASNGAVVVGSAAFSHDGQRLVMPSRSGFDSWKIVTQDLARGVTQMITGDDYGRLPAFTARDDSIVYLSREPMSFSVRPSDGSGTAVALPPITNWSAVDDIAMNGDWIAVSGTAAVGATNTDIGVFQRSVGGPVQPYANTTAREEAPAISPDGRWLAYTANVSGVDQVFVSPFPTPTSRTAASGNGGRLPVWSGDGRMLYFYNGKGSFVGLPFSAGTNGKPVLGAERTLYNRGYVRNWTMSPDGSSLIFIDTARLLRLLGLEVVLNLQPGS